ncbi:ABC transporter permease [Myxococcota bacterium]|nr:ABC transporter permease [Myxococcota bacterium]
MLMNLIKKEIKELLTPSTVAVILVITVLFGSMGKLIGAAKDEAKKKPTIAIVIKEKGPLADRLREFLRTKTTLIYEGDSREEGFAALKASKKGVALVIIDQGFEKTLLAGKPALIKVEWIMRGAGLMDTISSGILERTFLDLNKQISAHLIDATKDKGDLSSSHVLNPTVKFENTHYKSKRIPALSPNKIAQVLVSQSITIPMAVMIIIMLGGSMVITSMGLEKENKTLETLLTMPVSRTTIVMGKIMGSAAVGLFMAAFYMVGFKFYVSSFETGTIDLALLGLDLNAFDYILVGVSLFSSLLFGLAMAMLLGIMAKDYKSAQVLTYPIMGLAMIPMFLTMYRDFDTVTPLVKTVLFVIPFSHPMMAMRHLTLDNYLLVSLGIVYSLTVTAILIAIIVKIFKTDKLITGIMPLRKRA